MNALAGGGTFATLPALIAIGLPANIANATSNVALLPGAATSAWAFRDELGPLGGCRVRLLAAITFAGGLVGSVLLVLTPSHAFDLIIPWLLLFAFVVLAFGKRAAGWLQRARDDRAADVARRADAARRLWRLFRRRRRADDDRAYGLLAGHQPARAVRAAHADAGGRQSRPRRSCSSRRAWCAGAACLPMLAGAIVGGWVGARARQAAARVRGARRGRCS